jgi:hypothetical protein
VDIKHLHQAVTCMPFDSEQIVPQKINYQMSSIVIRDEVFNIEIKYNKQVYALKVKTDYPAGPPCMGVDFDIYQGRKHLYTLSQCTIEDDIECWEVKKKPEQGHDPVLVQKIGRAIDRYYN